MSDRADRLLVFNPLPWERSVSGPVSANVVEPRGGADDPFSARHYQDVGGVDRSYVLPPTEVPGYGYATVSRGDLRTPKMEYDTRGTVETDRYRLTFDRETGGVERWYDRRLDCEWVDPSADYAFASPVTERAGGVDEEGGHGLVYRSPEDVNGAVWHAAPELVYDQLDDEAADLLGWQSDWHAVRRGPDRVTRHRVYHTQTAYVVEQVLELAELADTVTLRVTVPREGPGVTVEAEWEASPDADRDSVYLSFPFALSDPTPRIDVGGQAVEPGADQLPGTNRDFFAVQRWVDFSEADRGMTVGCPLNPLVQLGGFTYGQDREEFALDDPLLLGWISGSPIRTETVRARYHFRPSPGPFDEARAHRIGYETEHVAPLVQTLGEPRAPDGRLPARGQLLDLPAPPVLVTSFQPPAHAPTPLRPAPEGSGAADEALLVLLNASDDPTEATVGSALVEIAGARRADLYGTDPADAIDEAGPAVTVPMEPREMVPLRVQFADGE